MYVLYDTTNFLSAGKTTKCDISIGNDRLDLATPNNTIATYRNAIEKFPQKPPILQIGKRCVLLVPDQASKPLPYKLQELTQNGLEDVKPSSLPGFFSGGDTLNIVYNSCIGIMLKLENIK